MLTFPLRIANDTVITGVQDSVLCKYTQRPMAQVCQASAEHVEQALQVAEACRHHLSHTSVAIRKRRLLALAESIEEHRALFALTIAQEAGKPWELAIAEVTRSVATIRLTVAQADVIGADTEVALTQNNVKAWQRRKPKGIVLAMTPFNFPLNLLLHKFAPSYLAGCPVILKPSPQAPLTALRLAKLVAEVGFVRGAFSVLPCTPKVAQLLVEDGRIAVLSFTGSDKVGFKLKRLTAAHTCLLELGGNAAVVIDRYVKRADLPAIAKKVAAGAFMYAGQVCISVQRVLVSEVHYKTFRRCLLNEMLHWQPSPRMLQKPLIGPMISIEAAEQARERVSKAVERGAVRHGEGRCDGPWKVPCVLENVTPEMAVWQEELFAPICTLTPFEDFQQAIDGVNASRYGLQVGLFSESEQHVQRAWRDMDCGALIVNEIPTWRDDAMPYGGVKCSGIGREGPKEALLAYSEPCMMCAHE